MKFGSITIKDIGLALGLASSTVSRALRDSHEIGAETKKRVQDYAAKMNYRPNLIAVSLKERETKTVGVIVPDLANNFFLQVLDGMESVAHAKGYNLIIAQSKDDFDRETRALQFLTSRGIDGLLLSVSAEMNDFRDLERLNKAGLPMVLFDRIAPGIAASKVQLDNFLGGKMAAIHLLQRGFKTIAVLAGPSHLVSTQERIQGFKAAAKTVGVLDGAEYIKYCENGGRCKEEVSELLKGLMDLPVVPDAIIVMSDAVSLQVLKCFKSHSVLAKANFGMVCFCNPDMAEIADAQVTVIVQPANELGVRTMQLLFDSLAKKAEQKEFKNITLVPQLLTLQ